MGPVDRAIKLLSRLLPGDFAHFIFPGRTLRVLEALDKELPASTLLGDKAWRVQEGDETWLLHVEFAIRVRHDTITGLFATAMRLHEAYLEPVVSVLVALSQEDAMANIPEVYGWSAGGQQRCRFTLDVVRMWDYDSREALESSSPVAWLLSVHMKGGRTRETLEKAAQRVMALTSIPTATRADLLAVLRIFGERGIGEIAREIITREMLMESGWYEEVLEEGKREGRREGERAGVNVLQNTLILQLIQRFDAVPAEIQQEIRRIEDLGALQALAAQVMTVSDLRGFRRLLHHF